MDKETNGETNRGLPIVDSKCQIYVKNVSVIMIVLTKFVNANT